MEWPAQKIMCQKRAIFSLSWYSVFTIRYTQFWMLISMAPAWLYVGW